VEIQSTQKEIFSIKFKGSFKYDLTAFEDSTKILQVADVWVKQPGGEEV
jgi:hypothetical protein